MRIPDEVVQLYDSTGPYATVYLDASHVTEHGAGEVHLRWRALRDELAEAGADQQTLAALDGSIGERLSGTHGRVLVAARGDLLLNAILPRPPVRPLARWAPLPHLMPYLTQEDPRIPHVVVVVDRAGADIFVSSGAATAMDLPPERDHVDGSHDYPLHKAPSGDWSESHYQRYVTNNWAANAKEVAHEAAQQVSGVHATLVVLAGDERARGLLRADLPGVLAPDIEIVEVTEGSRDEGSSDRELGDAIRGVLLHRALREREQTLDRLREASGHGLAVAGLHRVVDALRRAQIDTLVLVDEPTSQATAWIGPEPTHLALGEAELRDLGVDSPQRDRLDAALVRALAGSGASLLTVPPEDLSLPDGVAALLRYADASTPA